MWRLFCEDDKVFEEGGNEMKKTTQKKIMAALFGALLGLIVLKLVVFV